MDPSNKWLENEISELKLERNFKMDKKMQKKHNKELFISFMIVLIPLLCGITYANSTITCPHCSHDIELEPYAVNSASWKCRRCQHYNYSENPDWQGNFYCSRCGTRKGDD